MKSRLLLVIVTAGCAQGDRAATWNFAAAHGSLYADIRQAEWNRDGSGFVVTRSAKDRGDILVLDRSGAILETLVSTPANEVTGQWSPDGRTLVYYAAKESGEFSVKLVRADGTSSPALDPGYPTASPRWSPDGTALVFNSARGDEPRQIFVSDADGSNIRQLTFDERGHSDYRAAMPAGG